MRITLKKAHLFLDRLKKAVPKRSNNTSTGIYQLKVTATNATSGNLRQSMLKDIEVERKEVQNRLAIQKDINLLKEAVFAANLQNGISADLVTMTNIKTELKIMENDLSNIQKHLVDGISLDEAQPEFFKKVADNLSPEQYSQPSETITVILKDSDQLQAEIKTLKNRLMVLEDSVAEHNLTIKIDFEFSPESLEVLGL